MPPKKVKKFCRVTKYLEQIDKALYQALDDLCLFGLFRTRGRGITFMYPTDKSYRTKIIDHAYSNNPEKAIEMVRALVLLDFLPKSSMFKSKQDDIPNALHNKLDVLDANDTEVKLKSGHKLVLDTSFKTLRDDDNVAVYKLSGNGELPTTGIKSNMKYNNAKTTSGGYHGGNMGESDEIKLTKCVEKIYAGGQRGVYKTVMAILYQYAASPKGVDVKHIVYNKICASARASYYNIVAPWSLEKDPSVVEMIRDSQIVGLATCTSQSVGELISTYNDIKYTAMLKGLIAACGKEDTEDKTRSDKRDRLLTSIKSSAHARTEVLAAYNGDASRLYKDLLTVYCYLSALNEEELNDDYFTSTFVYGMKNVYNHKNSFTESMNETAYNLSVYYNLVKSDAFLYTPVSEKKYIDPAYADLDGVLPEPNNPKTFTIQFNNVVQKRGGGDSDTFFGGIMDSL